MAASLMRLAMRGKPLIARSGGRAADGCRKNLVPRAQSGLPFRRLAAACLSSFRHRQMSAQTFDLVFNGYWREAKLSGIPAQSGVFCVYVCTHDPVDKMVVLQHLIHIGETGNANSTIAQSTLWPVWNGARDNDRQQICFNFAPAESRYRRQIAATLIHAHKPATNDEFKTNFPYGSTVVTVSGQAQFLKKSSSAGM
jgi:hypothetical protein